MPAQRRSGVMPEALVDGQWVDPLAVSGSVSLGRRCSNVTVLVASLWKVPDARCPLQGVECSLERGILSGDSG